MKAGRPHSNLNTQKIHEGPYMFDVHGNDYFQQVANITDGLVCDELVCGQSTGMRKEQEIIKGHLAQKYEGKSQELNQLNEMGLENFKEDFLFIGQRMVNSVSDIFEQQYIDLIFSVFSCLNKSEEKIKEVRNNFFSGSIYFSLRQFKKLQKVLHQLKRANKKKTEARYNFLKNKYMNEISKDEKEMNEDEMDQIKKEINKQLRIIAKLEKNLKNKKKRKGRQNEKIQDLIQTNERDIEERFTKLFNDLIISIKKIKDWPLYVKQQRQMIQYLDKIINMYEKPVA